MIALSEDEVLMCAPVRFTQACCERDVLDAETIPLPPPHPLQVKRLRHYLYYLFGVIITTGHMSDAERTEEIQARREFVRECEKYGLLPLRGRTCVLCSSYNDLHWLFHSCRCRSGFHSSCLLAAL